MPRTPPEAALAAASLLLASYRRLLGTDLVADTGDAGADALALWDAPFVVAAHGTEADPVLFYGNRTALELWEMSWDDFTRTPSRLTAEAPERGERERLLEATRRDGFIRDYRGVRVSRTGKRFRIENVTVWNLADADGRYAGQAATFGTWVYLDG